MGACQSMQNGGDEEEKRKRSRAIDAKLEEDSRRLRKECKILLLGMSGPSCLRDKVADDCKQVPEKAVNPQ